MSSLLQRTAVASFVGRDRSRDPSLLPASQSFFRSASISPRLLDRRHRCRRVLPTTPSASSFRLRPRRGDGDERRRLLSSMAARYDHNGEDEDEDEDEDDEDDDGGPVEMNVFDRLALAWSILFPKKAKKNSKAFSPAQIAKQRLRMILISDRCAVNDSAKKKIVKNIVGALADFVEIEPRDRVRLNVCADPELGTVYSVSVPVRRVRHRFQQEEEEEEFEEEEEEFDGGGGDDDEAAEEKTSHQFTGGSLILNSSSSEINSSSSSSSVQAADSLSSSSSSSSSSSDGGLSFAAAELLDAQLP